MTAYAYELRDYFDLSNDYEELMEFCEGYLLPEQHGQWDKEIACFVKLYDDNGFIEKEDLDYAFAIFGNKTITEEQAEELISIYDTYTPKHERREQFICKCLSVATGKDYKAFTIRGCCQGDYATLLLPDDTSQEVVNRLEALYFGLGTGLIIEESDEPRNSPDEIEDGLFYFSEEYEPEKLKQAVTELTGCQEVVLWTIKGEKRVPIYEEH